ncbi:MAG TPA: hypothetical protein VNI02_22950 [Blastocatellia bacterium]|jgi:oligoendopeptidase F|nr:hypothetical protein [Blastocatellia bacterium]
MLDEYRREYADFHTAYMREHYLFLSGQKNNLQLEPIYDRYGDLFSRDSVAGLKKAADDTPEHFETERAAIHRLFTLAVEQFLESSVKELTQEISEYEALATVTVMHREMTFQDSAIAISSERERGTRRAIYEKRLGVIEASNDLRAERLVKLYDAARSLGHANYAALFEELRRLNYETLAREADALLARTESLYVARLNEALKRHLGFGVEEATRPDSIYFIHLAEFDERFPADQLLEVYGETMAGLGIRVESQKNITIDKEPRPHKSSRAFCLPVSVPGDIKLVIRPVGGQTDYQALFHESGHAQHYAWASEGLRLEFRHAGDYALTETYAFLFNHLISDASWLASLLNFQESREFIRSVMLARLVTVRRYVAKLAYERALHAGGDLARSADDYASLQTEATKFKTGPTEFLYDLDDSFYSASYVRAWAFEVALREHLKSRFGQRWWASQRAGNFLKEIWETGDRYTADEMASQIGIGPIAFDPLIDEFNEALRG